MGCTVSPSIGAVPIGTTLNPKATALQKCAVVPTRARIQGSWTFNNSILGLRGVKKREGVGCTVSPPFGKRAEKEAGLRGVENV